MIADPDFGDAWAFYYAYTLVEGTEKEQQVRVSAVSFKVNVRPTFQISTFVNIPRAMTTSP